jgi:Ring finger domain
VESESDKDRLDAAEVDKYLPLVNPDTLSEATEDMQACDQCMICLEKNLNGLEVRSILLCGHMFHSKCLLEWIELKYNCPNCKQDFSRQSLIEYERKRNPVSSPRKNGMGIMSQEYFAPMQGKPMASVQPTANSRPPGSLTRVVLNRRPISRTIIPGRRAQRMATGGFSTLNSSGALPTTAELAYFRPSDRQQPSIRGISPIAGSRPASLNMVPSMSTSLTAMSQLQPPRAPQAHQRVIVGAATTSSGRLQPQN